MRSLPIIFIICLIISCSKKIYTGVVHGNSVKIYQYFPRDKDVLGIDVSNDKVENILNIYDYKELRILHISNIGLDYEDLLPIGQLPYLRILSVAGNELDSIPKDVFELDSLKYLDISFNNLKVLPASISESNVSKLVVTSNQFSDEYLDSLNKVMEIEIVNKY